MSRVAAIDCGTNSIRLLVAEAGPEAGPGAGPEAALHELHRELRIVRLGQGIDATGEFARPALERTFAACEAYAELIERFEAGRVRFVATSAARDAGNAAEFFAGVRERLGVDPEIVSGAEEAELSFAGAIAGVGDLSVPEPYLVVDLGGGSTELVLGDRASGVQAACSIDIGSVRLTERHLHSDPPTAAELAAARRDVVTALARSTDLTDSLRDARTMIGVAGTMTTLAALALGLTDYRREQIHRARIPAADLRDCIRWVTGASRAQRAARRVIHPGRIDVIGAGALIAGCVFEAYAFRAAPGQLDELVVSETDILDGIAIGIADHS